MVQSTYCWLRGGPPALYLSFLNLSVKKKVLRYWIYHILIFEVINSTIMEKLK